MASTSFCLLARQRLRGVGKGSRSLTLPPYGKRPCCALSRLTRGFSRTTWLAPYSNPRPYSQPFQATNNRSGDGGIQGPENEDEELDELLGIGRFRDAKGGIFGSSSSSSSNKAEGTVQDGMDSSSEVQDTLADIMQMEVRRVRVKEELMTDLEDRKARMRAIGEELKAALAREYELDRMRTEMGANYAISEAFQALDEVEAEVQRMKQQVQADKADLAAWEAQAAEDRSRGLFFKSLYAIDKEPRKPVGKSIPGYWRKQRAAAEAASAAAMAAATSVGATGGAATEAAASSSSPITEPSSSSSSWDPEAVAAAAERPLSAASRQVRSPLRLYLFSYLSAFLALMVVNDVASSSTPHVAQDALYGLLSTGLALVAVSERQALGKAQDAMLEGIRKTAGRRRSRGPSDD